jgi:hypothetical protein
MTPTATPTATRRHRGSSQGQERDVEAPSPAFPTAGMPTTRSLTSQVGPTRATPERQFRSQRGEPVERRRANARSVVKRGSTNLRLSRGSYKFEVTAVLRAGPLLVRAWGDRATPGGVRDIEQLVAVMGCRLRRSCVQPELGHQLAPNRRVSGRPTVRGMLSVRFAGPDCLIGRVARVGLVSGSDFSAIASGGRGGRGRVAVWRR